MANTPSEISVSVAHEPVAELYRELARRYNDEEGMAQSFAGKRPDKYFSLTFKRPLVKTASEYECTHGSYCDCEVGIVGCNTDTVDCQIKASGVDGFMNKMGMIIKQLDKDYQWCPVKGPTKRGMTDPVDLTAWAKVDYDPRVTTPFLLLTDALVEYREKDLDKAKYIVDNKSLQTFVAELISLPPYVGTILAHVDLHVKLLRYTCHCEPGNCDCTVSVDLHAVGQKKSFFLDGSVKKTIRHAIDVMFRALTSHYDMNYVLDSHSRLSRPTVVRRVQLKKDHQTLAKAIEEVVLCMSSYPQELVNLLVDDVSSCANKRGNAMHVTNNLSGQDRMYTVFNFVANVPDMTAHHETDELRTERYCLYQRNSKELRVVSRLAVNKNLPVVVRFSGIERANLRVRITEGWPSLQSTLGHRTEDIVVCQEWDTHNHPILLFPPMGKYRMPWVTVWSAVRLVSFSFGLFGPDMLNPYQYGGVRGDMIDLPIVPDFGKVNTHSCVQPLCRPYDNSYVDENLSIAIQAGGNRVHFLGVKSETMSAVRLADSVPPLLGVEYPQHLFDLITDDPEDGPDINGDIDCDEDQYVHNDFEYEIMAKEEESSEDDDQMRG